MEWGCFIHVMPFQGLFCSNTADYSEALNYRWEYMVKHLRCFPNFAPCSPVGEERESSNCKQFLVTFRDAYDANLIND